MDWTSDTNDSEEVSSGVYSPPFPTKFSGEGFKLLTRFLTRVFSASDNALSLGCVISLLSATEFDDRLTVHLFALGLVRFRVGRGRGLPAGVVFHFTATVSFA